ncbi:MAG: MFS transporter [Deltaproteobacteria bacterium]|nr:MAG: MFS transporter [Deltaproteobacteria bacterium]
MPTPAPTPYRALDRRIWLLAGARAVNTAGLSLAMAFMAIYLVTERGLSGTVTGVLYAGANLLQAVSQGLAGDVSDRIGRRVTMVAALAGRAVLVTALGIAVTANAAVWVVVALLYASWIVRGWFEPVAYAAVADVAPPDQRVAAIGLQKIGVNLGWAVGPAAGGFLLRWFDYGAVFFFAAPIIAAAAAAVACYRDPPRRTPARRARVRPPALPLRVWLFLACALVSGLVHGQLFSTFSLYVKAGVGLGEDALGALWTINAVCVLALQLPAVAAVRRAGTRVALVAGAVLYVAAFVGFGVAPGFAGLAASMIVLTAGEVVLEPAQQAMAARLADPERMGRAMGLLGFMRMFGLAFALLVGGAAFDAFPDRPLAMWSVLAAIAAALAAGYAAFGAVTRRQARPPEAHP